MTVPLKLLEDNVVADDAANNGYQQLANVVILVSLLIAGLVSLGIIAATFPLLARITGPEVARNE